MGLTKDEAYTILELPYGANQDEVRSSYKRLALKWHPDKHANSPEATKKFQEVSSAYKRLTSNDSDDEINLTPADMFDLFAHFFFHRNGMFGCYPGRPMYDSDDTYYSDDDDDDDDDEDDDDNFNNDILHSVASNLRRKYEKRPTDRSSGPVRSAHNLSEAEAMKNAKELIEEEERDRKKAERRRAKKKRNKERKKEREREREKQEKDEKENIQQKNIKKENIPTSSKTSSKDSDKKNKSTSNVPSTPNKTVNSNTKITNGLKEQCANSTNLQQHGRKDKTSKKRHDEDNVSGGEEPSWDTSSAFFNRAAGRNPTPAPTSGVAPLKSINNPTVGAQTSTNSKSGPGQQTQTDQIDPVVLRSRQVAVKGNEMANQGNYPAAVDLFTEAINLDAKDFRFFGNRSYCYDRMNQYEKALQDADVAISLAPDWPKGYFRRGRALAGLKLFSDAESSFAQVLKLDKHCEDAMFELERVRMQQLEEMGFPQSQSEAAIQAYGTVQAALEALLAGKVNLPQAEEIYVSDGEDNPRKPTSTKHAEHESSSDGPCRSLWVGNINPDEVGERHLLQLFSRCGRVDNVRILPKRFCAFVNYERAESANLALENLQGVELGGEQILLRYPTNSGVQLGTQALASNPSVLPKRKPIDMQVKPATSKMSGPVNGDECYFWRTTGCYFAEKCRFRHVPENKGLDLKKVEAKYGGKLRAQPPTN